MLSISQIHPWEDAVTVNDAALFFGDQVGGVGWGTLIQVGDGLNQSPLKTTGSIIAIKGSPTIANGIDLSGAGSITGSAFKSPSFSVDGSGNGLFGNPTTAFRLAVQKPDSSATALFAGTTKGLRIGNTPSGSAVEGVDNTGVGSFQPLFFNGTTLTFQTNGGTQALLLDASQSAIFAGAVVSTGAGGVGYATGAGGTVTQATTKSTGVTLNKITGQITMNNASLAAGTLVSFTLTDSTIAATNW
jgi:hypothetical protein